MTRALTRPLRTQEYLKQELTAELAPPDGADGKDRPMSETTARCLERTVESMHENLGEPLTVDDLARTAMFSKFHFSRVFQRMTGLSPVRFLSALRIEEAKRLLRTTTLTVADISHQVGYNSVGTFSTRFHSSVGMSPREYRRGDGAEPELPQAPSRPGPDTARISGHVVRPESEWCGPVFLGVFPTALLEGTPVASAVLARCGSFSLPAVPAGSWYLHAQAAAQDGGATAEPAIFTACHGPVELHAGVTTLAEVRLRPRSLMDPPALLEIPAAVSRPWQQLELADEAATRLAA
jgi:AraC family transcriptional regulator